MPILPNQPGRSDNRSFHSQTTGHTGGSAPLPLVPQSLSAPGDRPSSYRTYLPYSHAECSLPLLSPRGSHTPAFAEHTPAYRHSTLPMHSHIFWSLPPTGSTNHPPAAAFSGAAPFRYSRSVPESVPTTDLSRNRNGYTLHCRSTVPGIFPLPAVPVSVLFC